MYYSLRMHGIAAVAVTRITLGTLGIISMSQTVHFERC